MDWTKKNPYRDVPSSQFGVSPVKSAAPASSVHLASQNSSFLSAGDHADAADAPTYGSGRIETRNPSAKRPPSRGDDSQMATLKNYVRCLRRSPAECLGSYFDVDTDDVLARIANSVALCNAPPKPGYVAPVMKIAAVPPVPLSPADDGDAATATATAIPPHGSSDFAPVPASLSGLGDLDVTRPTHVIDDDDEDQDEAPAEVDVKVRPGESLSVRGDRYSFVEELRGNPDLYGPFWIGLTLSFVIAVSSNVSGWANGPAADEEEQYEYDLHRIFHAVAAVYVYSVGTPCFVYSSMLCFGIGLAKDTSADRSVSNEITVTELVCLYGYALVPWIPAALFCMIPHDAVDWSALGAAAGCSLLLILRNVVGPLVSGDGANAQTSGLVIGSVIGSHVVFLLVVKLAFYRN